jgi:hypothetical protein
MLITDIEDAMADLIAARRDKNHEAIRAIEDYLSSQNIAIDKMGERIRWRKV